MCDRVQQVHPGAATKHLASTCDLSDTAETRVGYAGRISQLTFKVVCDIGRSYIW
jgi:hypothetical protein